MSGLISRELRENVELLTYPDKMLNYAPSADSEAKKLTVKDLVVRVDDSTYTCTIWLPPVAEAAGLTFQISAATGTKDVTITDFGGASYNDSLDWSDVTLSADEDQATFYSTGTHWVIVEDKST